MLKIHVSTSDRSIQSRVLGRSFPGSHLCLDGAGSGPDQPVSATPLRPSRLRTIRYTNGTTEAASIDETALITAGVALFTICNPIGTIPVFLSVTSGAALAKQRRIAMMTGAGVFAVLAVSLLLGSLILQFFGIGVPALKIAGFLFVASIAWAMMTKTGAILPQQKGGNPAIVPLAIPVVAGPGAIALVIAFAKENPAFTDYLWGLLIILASAVATAVIYFFAPYLAKLLGAASMNIFQKLFGLILLAICVDQVLTAMPSIWPGLAGTSS